jgi:large subunit ribosomal protein L35
VPKLKTHKAAAKRFKITATGRVLRPKGFGNKKRSAKSKRTKRMYDEFFPVAPSTAKMVKHLVPYAF